MRLTKRHRLSCRHEQKIAPRFLKEIRISATLLYFLALALMMPAGLYGQKMQEMPLGIAWRVRGPWHVDGKKELISTGDAIEPGALLQPAEGTNDHSITLLLPDGQRVLYECFTVDVCARGFRVPSLYRKPQAVAIDLLARVNAVLTQTADSSRKFESVDQSPVPQDEAVGVLGPRNQVEIEGLAAKLSNGSYWYRVRGISRNSQAGPRLKFEKTGNAITLSLPSDGLFDILIVDSLNTPRIDLLIAASHEPRAEALKRSFEDVKSLLLNWNEDYQGWPIHEFQRAYLRSLLLGIRPSPQHAGKNAVQSTANGSANATAEPRFSPHPGVFRSDTEVTLRCDTKDAIIHYTVDGSQPIDDSTVYHAPIVVKGTALTIKAFASAKGKKDSPVVTGIFRIGD